MNRSKAELRDQVWRILEETKVSRFPGARGRIPNFKGAEQCVQWLDQLSEWQDSKVLKCNPDSPQRSIRYAGLKEGKIIYMAVPRLAEKKPFVELDPNKLNAKKLYEASSIKGAFHLGRPVSIQQMRTIDLVVCGSVAVNRYGERVGKGEGYSELEFALAVEAGKMNRGVSVLTSIHPLQLIKQRIERKRYDFSVDIILMPDEILRCPADQHRPKGIYRNDLTTEKLNAIPALRHLQPG